MEDPDEPFEPDEPDEADDPVAPSVAGSAQVAGATDFEYRVEALTDADLQPAALAERLNTGASDGWHLVQVVASGGGSALILRRHKTPARSNRPVGFSFPARAS